MKTFGASAPLKELQTKFGFTPENVVNAARTVLRRRQTNPLKILQNYGQSVWLDFIRRSLITSGELQRLLDEDGLRGVTSNPAIFEKAIAGSNDYEADLKALERHKNLDAKEVYERLAIRDIQEAADVLAPLYVATGRRDGYVSLEVSPDLANDTGRTTAEARRLWKAVARENVMIKVPATPAGIPAIQQLIADGINVNVTLLFAPEAYQRVATAFIEGLEAFGKAGGDVSRVASVASFFISRIDALIDARVGERLKTSTDAMEAALLKGLLGKVAIANAKLTYQRYKEIYAGPRWQALAARGAQTQRLLWASTSTKNANYRDVVYVEELIGKDTVNTIPPATFDAFRDHGRPRASLEANLEEAADTMQTLEKVGISMTAVTDTLLNEGVKIFVDAFVKLIAAVSKRFASPELVKRQTVTLPPDLDAAVRTVVRDWETGGKVRRLWARDATLWTGSDEADWLGWLGITDDQIANIDHLHKIQADARSSGVGHVLLLGMGGSSLCPEVLKMTFGKIAGHPELHVLDSTDPAQIKAVERKVDLGKTLFVVSSKSGSTLEPNIFKQYFFERTREVVGPDRVGSRFIAITDPGSKLHRVAEADRFRHVFFGLPSIGGRFSALSDFGLVPAAVMGIDVARFLGQADQMAKACASSVPVQEDLGAEFFRWEFATAVAGAVLGINTFNQPDVEASKTATRKLTTEYERTGTLPPETLLRIDDRNVAAQLARHLARVKANDYVALLAYIEMTDAHEAELQKMRTAIRDRYKVATCVGFGPRFLHSTGQAYKGGPSSGVFLQITCDDAADLPVPGQTYTFGVVKAAQARGDLEVLEERGRRALRVHLGSDVAAGLKKLRATIEQAIA